MKKRLLKKRIVFLYNNYEREHVIIELISMELRKYNCKVCEIGMTDPKCIKRVLLFRPQIIVTYPITTMMQKDIYTYIKKLLKCKIITYTTEGLFDYNKKDVIKIHAGTYDYSSDLIDYHVYWGKLAARKIGKELYLQKKLRSSKQIRVFGNPMYEKNKIQVYYQSNKYKDILRKWNQVILVLTGFVTSEYTIKDYVNAQDIVNVKDKDRKGILNDPVLNEWLMATEHQKRYREKYIAAIVDAAKKNVDTLYVVKLHPQEMLFKKNRRTAIKYIECLKNIENILVIDESIPVGILLPYCNLMVHYGSTVDLEAYIYKVPTLKLELRNISNDMLSETSRLTESTYYADVDEMDIIDKYTKGIKDGTVSFRTNSKIEKQLDDLMNYKVESNYKPSKEFARFLCSDLKGSTLDIKYFEWKALLSRLVKEFRK